MGKDTIESEPVIEQLFIGASPSTKTEEFEAVLYQIRKTVGAHFDGGALDDARTYFCSLSSKTIVYKGLFTPHQLHSYFAYDFNNPLFKSYIALVHSRFSTNTFPSWERAQPTRMLAHNGEINTLNGNVRAMQAREGALHSTKFKKLEEFLPIIGMDNSDSGSFDNCAELLAMAGRPLAGAMLLMMPGARDESLPETTKNMYVVPNYIHLIIFFIFFNILIL